ncbi:hypothetical protein GMRT_11847 [Giardia muris]|uniref:Uncharacterized protein n=1 Tax=Giardia muris TaxID=5742 RepID=A0A4Z1T8S4_GIAMU|nr:hypothetical protein GMRT_11847 [Giardia muris]|eukprot:TNJ28979.1 hypothetical protein GMRT_11847 [Giardia muris]
MSSASLRPVRVDFKPKAPLSAQRLQRVALNTLGALPKPLQGYYGKCEQIHGLCPHFPCILELERRKAIPLPRVQEIKAYVGIPVDERLRDIGRLVGLVRTSLSYYKRVNLLVREQTLLADARDSLQAWLQTDYLRYIDRLQQMESKETYSKPRLDPMVQEKLGTQEPSTEAIASISTPSHTADSSLLDVSEADTYRTIYDPRRGGTLRAPHYEPDMRRFRAELTKFNPELLYSEVSISGKTFGEPKPQAFRFESTDDIIQHIEQHKQIQLQATTSAQSLDADNAREELEAVRLILRSAFHMQEVVRLAEIDKYLQRRIPGANIKRTIPMLVAQDPHVRQQGATLHIDWLLSSL